MALLVWYVKSNINLLEVQKVPFKENGKSKIKLKFH